MTVDFILILLLFIILLFVEDKGSLHKCLKNRQKKSKKKQDK